MSEIKFRPRIFLSNLWCHILVVFKLRKAFPEVQVDFQKIIISYTLFTLLITSTD